MQVLLYLATSIFILLSVFSPISSEYQFFYLIGALISIIAVMFITTFKEESDS